jgi:tRNA(Ile)-lysidine synthase
VKDQFPQLVEKDEIPLTVPEEVALGNGWFCLVRQVDYEPAHFEGMEVPGEDFLVWMAQEAMAAGAVLRVRKEGDSIQPLGMGGKSIKVSDLMINEKIPAPYRADWPLVAREETVLWVPGGRLSREVRITETTQEVVELRFIHRKA